ncbi:polyphosphate kinase 2 [Mongoliitalea lutea]|uniref:ADP/GDP-polyphosphate phosphotransferase n=1 Tax=Mongoliitalea lutea TaxID=849756 RepID=A0A8J3CZ09_9BACT|nr:polyphosphate kinase 2 [Mongoliitalea lutea]GHB46927.1 polyphosphate kinase 2 [Mongoliitalea lutea]
MFKLKHLEKVQTRKELIALAKSEGVNLKPTLKKLAYEEELRELQTELALLLQHIIQHQLRVAVIFEGRDAAGKGGSIKRFVEHLNPHASGVVALTKPTDIEKGQWYFQRYIEVLPNRGEIKFFDRSWYNRAVVEPVMGFCTKEQYHIFMSEVPSFEYMLHEDGIKLIKFWFDISKDEQKKRFDSRLENPLKNWKFSPVDLKGQELWDENTHYKEQMFTDTHTVYSPWVIVETNNKELARLESLRYVLSQFDYEGKGSTKATLQHDPNVVYKYFRKSKKLDL